MHSYDHAKYLKLDSGGSVLINRDFEDMTMRPEMLVAYVAAVAQAGLPVSILLEAMQQGGLIGPDEDLDKIEAEMAANAAAIVDQQAQAQADALAVKQAGQNNPPAVNALDKPKTTTHKIVRGKSGKAKKLVSTTN